MVNSISELILKLLKGNYLFTRCNTRKLRKRYQYGLLQGKKRKDANDNIPKTIQLHFEKNCAGKMMALQLVCT